MDPNEWKKWDKKKIYKEKSWGIVTQPKNGCWGSLLGGFGQHIPSDLVTTYKKQQAKACWKCCKTHQSCQKIYVFTQKFFTYKNLKMKSLYLTYLWVLETETQMEMDAANKMEQEKARSVRRFQG